MPGGTRPGPVPLTAAAVAAVLLAAIGLVGGPAVRGAIGAGTSSVTLPGTGVVVVHSGDAGTLDAAGAADGSVVAVVGGVPTLVAAAAGGPTISSGTYASRPASPAVGDLYTVTSGARRGSVYRAPAAGVWELWRVLSPVSSATVMLDGERFENSATGGWVLTWPGELGASAVAVSQHASMTVLSGAAGGLPGVALANPVGMRVPWMGPSGAAARWLAVVMSRAVASSDTYQHIAGWGEANPGKLFAMTLRTGGVTRMGAHWWSSNLASSTAPVTGTTPSVYLLQYDGSTATLYQDNSSIASGAVVLNTGTSLPLILGVNPGTLSEPATCTLHAVLAGSGTLDGTARAALQTWAQDRFGAP